MRETDDPRPRRRGRGRRMRIWQWLGGLVLLGFLATAFTPMPNLLADRLRTLGAVAVRRVSGQPGRQR